VRAAEPLTTPLADERRRFMGQTPWEDDPSADWVRVPTGSVSPVGALPKRDASRLGSLSCGRSLLCGFAFQIPASSACARSLLVPGTCDLTR
jgi:hypothetical protein